MLNSTHSLTLDLRHFELRLWFWILVSIWTSDSVDLCVGRGDEERRSEQEQALLRDDDEIETVTEWVIQCEKRFNVNDFRMRLSSARDLKMLQRREENLIIEQAEHLSSSIQSLTIDAN